MCLFNALSVHIDYSIKRRCQPQSQMLMQKGAVPTTLFLLAVSHSPRAGHGHSPGAAAHVWDRAFLKEVYKGAAEESPLCARNLISQNAEVSNRLFIFQLFKKYKIIKHVMDYKQYMDYIL